MTFPSGLGQRDTRAITLSDGRPNPHKRAGTPYETITTAEIGAMAKNPQTSPKEHARWFIPSTYNDHDARIHEVQRLYGSFAWLTLDVDTNNLSLEAVDATLSHVIGEASRIIYSTRSAKRLFRPVGGCQRGCPDTRQSSGTASTADLSPQPW